MSIYTIEETKKTPSIYFDPQMGDLKIKGRSLPVDCSEFYQDLFSLVDSYLKNPKRVTTLHFNFDYVNTISTKVILQLIQKFEKLLHKHLDVHIVWNYTEEDDIMFEIGETFQVTTKIPLSLVEANVPQFV